MRGKESGLGPGEDRGIGRPGNEITRGAESPGGLNGNERQGGTARAKESWNIGSGKTEAEARKGGNGRGKTGIARPKTAKDKGHHRWDVSFKGCAIEGDPFRSVRAHFQAKIDGCLESTQTLRAGTATSQLEKSEYCTTGCPCLIIVPVSYSRIR